MENIDLEMFMKSGNSLYSLQLFSITIFLWLILSSSFSRLSNVFFFGRRFHQLLNFWLILQLRGTFPERGLSARIEEENSIVASPNHTPETNSDGLLAQKR